jgi:hypothetical protein
MIPMLTRLNLRFGCPILAWLCAGSWLAGGCTTMTPGRIDRVQPQSDRPIAGNVYLLRGWIGIFSYGINRLGEELDEAGIRVTVYQDDQWETLANAIQKQYMLARSPEPLVLIGHSYGADDVLRISRQLTAAGVAVDLVVTLDPVSPPDVPAGVKRCYNLYQSNGAWDKVPMFRGVPLKLAVGSRARLQNADVRTDRLDLLEPGTNHFNIEKKGKIHEEVLRQVLAVCPLRAAWVKAHGAPPPPPPPAPPPPAGPPRPPRTPWPRSEPTRPTPRMSRRNGDDFLP